MPKKIVISLLALLITFHSFVKLNRAEAASLAPIIKATSGSAAEKIILASMEKSGVSFTSKTAREQAIDKWRLTAYEQYQKDNAAGLNDDLWNQLNAIDTTASGLTVTPIPDKPGFGKVVVDSSLYLTAASIGYSVGDALWDAYNNNKKTHMLNDVTEMLDGVDTYDRVFGVNVIPVYDYNFDYNGRAYQGLATRIDNGIDTVDSAISWNKVSQPLLKITNFVVTGASALTITYVKTYFDSSDSPHSSEEIKDVATDTTDAPMEYEIIPTDVPTITVPEVLQPLKDTAGFPQTLPDVGPTTELVIPLDSNPDGMTSPNPWNDPIGEPGTDSPPPDDGGTTDGGDTGTSDPTNPFKNLVPVALLMALLDLLRAILEYLGRMFAFIGTIPLIPPKTIDNTAFQWFRNAEIIGVKIYSVVSTLASIGLSFAVYKSIRKLLP